MTKMINRAKQAEATKNRIYECGVNLIRKHGFDRVTVEHIAFLKFNLHLE
jgi:AcrR family transcriptional regulator